MVRSSACKLAPGAPRAPFLPRIAVVLAVVAVGALILVAALGAAPALAAPATGPPTAMTRRAPGCRPTKAPWDGGGGLDFGESRRAADLRPAPGGRRPGDRGHRRGFALRARRGHRIGGLEPEPGHARAQERSARRQHRPIGHHRHPGGGCRWRDDLRGGLRERRRGPSRAVRCRSDHGNGRLAPYRGSAGALGARGAGARGACTVRREGVRGVRRPVGRHRAVQGGRGVLGGRRLPGRSPATSWPRAAAGGSGTRRVLWWTAAATSGW